jgi:hypothetical protein
LGRSYQPEGASRALQEKRRLDQSWLALVLSDQEKILLVSDDENDIEEAQDTKNLAERLLGILPEIFPQDEHNQSESTALFHDDLSLQNILVDDHAKITGVIDWECVSALPLWRACQLPQFLEGRERVEEPQRDQYSPDDGEDETSDKEQLDNEGVNSLYWEHLMDWELAQLRKTFLEEMNRLSPEWIKTMEEGVEKADFENAVQNCDNSWRTKKINAWLDARDRGEKWSLRKKFFA